MEDQGRKIKGIVVERSRGRVSWVRFGETGLGNLVGCLELCCRDGNFINHSFDWSELGRMYRVDSWKNEAGRFILVSIKDPEGKRLKVFIPEGKSLIKGWFLMVESFWSWVLFLLL